jgi:hypothetical protein
MTQRIPLPAAFRQAREMASDEAKSNWPRYREVYQMALDGTMPAEQIRGRWYANPGVIAGKLRKSAED